MKTRLGVAVVLLAMLFFCQALPALAQDGRTLDDASAQEVVGGMANKAARGVANLATGWLEFPKQIVNSIKEDGVAKGIALGPLKGLGMTIARTLSGVGETATFFIAYPGFFDPYLDPPYVWNKE